jgi:hypothetical protein
MSTRCSLAYGENFHLYHECFEDDQTVHLELNDVEFEASGRSVTVAIPIGVWEVIRHKGGANLELADKTDAELMAMVKEHVDDRVAKWQEAKKEDEQYLKDHPEARDAKDGRIGGRKAGLFEFFGCIPYGRASEPKPKQVKAGIKHYKRERAFQKKVKEFIEGVAREERESRERSAASLKAMQDAKEKEKKKK